MQSYHTYVTPAEKESPLLRYDVVTTGNHRKEAFLMDSVAQESPHRLAVLQYASRHGITQAAEYTTNALELHNRQERA